MIRKLVRVCLALFALLFLCGLAAYYQAPRLLCVDSGEAKAAALIVLGGGSPEREIRAAELFRSGAAPRIVVSGSDAGDGSLHFLQIRGVPSSAVRMERQSRTTQENARDTVRILREERITNAIIVTSWYHSRRALHCFQKAAPDIRFCSRPSYWGAARSEWAGKGLRRFICIEYLKVLYSWVRFGVTPF